MATSGARHRHFSRPQMEKLETLSFRTAAESRNFL